MYKVIFAFSKVSFSIKNENQVENFRKVKSMLFSAYINFFCVKTISLLSKELCIHN